MEQPLISTLAVDKMPSGQAQPSITERIRIAFVAHRIGILITVLSFVCLAILQHAFLSRYVAQAVLLVQRAENSPLQAMMGKMTGNPNFGNRRNEYLEKYLQYLNSHEFFLVAARTIQAKGDIGTSSETPHMMRELLTRTMKGFQSLLYVRAVDPSEAANEVEEMADKLRRNAAFVKTGQDILTVQVRHPNFRQAVKTANFLAETAVRVITERELKELNDAKQYIESEQASTGARLQEFDSAIIAYRKKNQLVKSDAGGGEALARVADLKRNLETNRLKFEHNEKLIALLSQEVQKQEAQILTLGAKSLQSSEVINQLRQQIQTLRYKKMLFQAQGMSEEAPAMQTLNQEIDQLALRIKDRIKTQGGNEDDAASLLVDDKDGLIRKISYLKRENQYLGTSIETLSLAVREAMQPLDELPAAQQKMVGFGRNTQLEFALLQEMRKKTLEIELERVALDSKVRILEQATIAGIAPIFNLLPKVLFGALIGLLIAVGVAYVADEVSNKIKSRREISELGMVIIGSVPKVQGTYKRGAIWKLHNRLVNVLASWRNEEERAEVMAFKHVRATVLKMRTAEGARARTICVLGATPGDGKSFVSANIALSLAQMGKKTLIMDGDLRRPSLSSWFDVSTRLGLTSFLTEQAPLEQCLASEVQPNLDLFPSGPIVRRATELFSERKFGELIERLQKEYEYIVIDTPPILSVVDGLLISALADATIFAVSHRKTRFPDLQQAMEKVRYFDERPVFVVYNRAEEVSQYNYVYASTRKKSFAAGLGTNLREELASFKKSWRKSVMEKETQS